ncbi:hypothetical protein GORHZ_171_00010, partial [Gordonia rhizosphera NBRC 16068]
LIPENLHVQQLVRATWNGRQGLGVLEQLAVGPLRRYGFRDFLDGAPAEAEGVRETADGHHSALSDL